ncbi:MAG: zinc metallopeptidase [Clostridia bacterium]|nr:zinc metallopeptidase [Clostridia bacterium]
MIASANVNSTFRRYQKQFSRRGITAAEAARMVLRAGGATGVQIARTHGNLTDHFDPRDNTIYLSEAVFDSTSTAAIGVAAHEAGHAVQHAVGYLPIRIRAAIIPVTNIGARFAPLLIMIGLFLSIYAAFPFGYELALLGVFFYSFSVIFQLVTLPTEFNASARAMAALKNENILDDVELVGARKTLTAAAMTYVASLAASLIQLIRLFAIVTSGRRRD